MRKGFTLIELVLTVSVLGIMAVFVDKMLLIGIDSYASVHNRTRSLQQARGTINRMFYEAVKLPQGSIFGVADSQLDFIDLQGNPTNYRQGQSGVEQTAMRGADLLSDSIGFVNFDGYDQAGALTSDPAQVRRIKVELNSIVPGGFGSMSFRTEVFPRTFMYQGFQ